MVVASALVVALAPATNAYSRVSIFVYDKRVPASTMVTVAVDTIGAGPGASFVLQVKQQGTWRKVAGRHVNQYASYKTFRYQAPAVAQTITFRARLIADVKVVATSKLVNVEVTGGAPSPTVPVPTPSPTATPSPSPTPTSTDPVVLSAEIPGQVGQWMSVGKYKFRFGPTISGDAAWRTVGTETLAKKPAAGYSTVLASVDYEMTTPPTLGVGSDVKFDYVGNDGVVYGPGDELSSAGRCTYTLAP
ncbi:hypothetical protein JZU54_07005, partial [bacterium]|nr:hypothetical protein [bacterium]